MTGNKGFFFPSNEYGPHVTTHHILKLSLHGATLHFQKENMDKVLKSMKNITSPFEVYKTLKSN